MISASTLGFQTTMLFWVASWACKAIQTKVISIWRALGALCKETSLTNLLLNNNIYHYPSCAMITSEASCFENLFSLFT